MNQYLLLDVNIFSMLLLLSILLSIILQKNRHSYSTRLFLTMLFSTLLLLLLECGMLYSKTDKILVYIIAYSFILLTPLPAALWLSYLDFQLNDSVERIEKRFYYLLPIVVLAAIILLCDVWLKPQFFIAFQPGAGLYMGTGLWVVGGISYSLVLFSFFLAWKHRGHLENRLILTLFFLSILPVFGAVIQTLDHGLPTKWPLVTLSVCLAYLFVEIQHEGRDYLTGLYNRKQLDDWLHHRMRVFPKKGPFSLILIDLNLFKKINDTFGHKEGDRALVDFARLISRSVKQNDMVSRFGGDEFLILLETGDSEVVERVIQRIEKRTAEENLRRDTGYSISFSAGYALYSPDAYSSARELFHDADMRMYEDKQKSRDVRIDA